MNMEWWAWLLVGLGIGLVVAAGVFLWAINLMGKAFLR